MSVLVRYHPQSTGAFFRAFLFTLNYDLQYAPKKVPKSQLEILKFSIELPLSCYNNCNAVKISEVLSYRIHLET